MVILVGINIFDSLHLASAFAEQSQASKVLAEVQSKQGANGSPVGAINDIDGVAELVASDVVCQSEPGRVANALQCRKITEQRVVGDRARHNFPARIGR